MRRVELRARRRRPAGHARHRDARRSHIGSRGILGIDSDGMLCSARELGLGSDHTGIIVLAAELPLGVPYGDVTGLVDRRGARPGRHPQPARRLRLPRRRPRPRRRSSAPVHAAHACATVSGEQRPASVDIVDGDRCGRFALTVLSGVVVGPSAPWMAARLRAVGQRPISNVVDVSNYVMLELNQPNHAYDYDTLGGHGIRVRVAKDGEQLTTLDDVDADADGRRPVDL